MASTDKGNLININSIAEEKEGKNGGIVITDTNAHTGNFTAILVTATAVITAVGNITITALTVTAGVRIPGEFTSITLASGSVIAYEAAS